ncbi:MAG: recombinase family protein [Alphaproteobacteria bacterium]|nr:recombinase family protein [Alphaproteobacteria bacterium]
MTFQAKPDGKSLVPSHWLPPEVELVSARTGKLRAVIYARFSKLSENEPSIERQVDAGMCYIDLNDYTFVRTYEDRQRTGTTTIGRDALLLLRKDAAARLFDIVVVEDIDRLGRKLKVTVDLWTELDGFGIALHDTSSGKLSVGQIGTKGGHADEDCTKLVTRNQSGKRDKVRKGGFGANNCFGYKRALRGSKVIFVVNEEEAVIVREIFDMYIKGVSPEKIAHILNKRPPEKRGNRVWKRGYIAGSAKFGTGILRRIRYAGLTVYGRLSIIKSPETNKSTVRVNPARKWAQGELDPSLIIVAFDIFDRVQKILLERSTAWVKAKAERPPRWTTKHYALRGLLRCASCGWGMTPTCKRRESKPRVICNAARNKDGCDNVRSTALEHINEAVLEMLKDQLAMRETFDAYAVEYNRQQQISVKSNRVEMASVEKQLAEKRSELDATWGKRTSAGFSNNWLEKKRADLCSETEALELQLENLKNEHRHNFGELTRDRNAERALLVALESVFETYFDTTTVSGVEVIGALRALVESVVVDFQTDAIFVKLHCRVSALAGVPSQDIITVTKQIPRLGRCWEDSKVEMRRIDRIVESGKHALSNSEWSLIESRIPACIAISRRGGTPMDPRAVVNAALLHLNEGVPLARMPAAFGPQAPMLSALKRLSSSGAWDIVLDVLHRFSPERLPAKGSEMFPTLGGRFTTRLKGLPQIRRRHALDAEAGAHAPTDAEWALIAEFIPEQVLTVQKAPAQIQPREFFHALMLMLKDNIPVAHMPLQFGSEIYLTYCIRRLVTHGYWDQIVERLRKESPDTISKADLSRFNIYARPSKGVTVWRSVLPKAADLAGVPSHFPTDAEWRLIKHLFPSELLFVNNAQVVQSPRILAHAMLYRVKEKVPIASFPPYFGDQRPLNLVMCKFVFHHLWDETVAILNQNSPETLKGANLQAFSRFKRSKTHRYARLLPAKAPVVPPHAPTDEQWAAVEDLIPADVLRLRGAPPIMQPRTFFHAILFMVTERAHFGALPKTFFGSHYELKFAMRKLIRHHLWDTIVARMQHFYPDWTATLDLQRFDNFPRSPSENSAMRHRKPRKRDENKAVTIEATLP